MNKDMKKYKFIFLVTAALFAVSCNDLLDRPQLNNPDDATYWTSEVAARLFANEFYSQFFVGYNSGWGTDYTPIRGYNFNDDMLSLGAQTAFPAIVPATVPGGNNNTVGTNNVSAAPAWQALWAGPNWYFGWIRKANLMIDRVETRMGDILNEEQSNHWIAVARFFRAMDYARLVSVFGDIPYFDKEVDISNRALMFKNRDSREVVMDAIYADFEFALHNLRPRHRTHAQELNQDVAAAFISRWMLFEGTWQLYHNNNTERATRFLNFAVEAADMLIESGRYSIDRPFRELFGSQDLAPSKEPILFRSYSAGLLMHPIASWCNPYFESEQTESANLSLIQSFIANDGEVWQNSAVADANKFDLQNLIITRDPRFEATFHNELHTRAVGFLWTSKFVSRAANATDAMYISNTNTNDAPIIRYGEVLLNWIEAKAVLAAMGRGPAVSQNDINVSINALRARPLDAVAIARDVKQTAAMNLSTLPNDPTRDTDVPQLIWEIRRERRMEMYGEHARLLDLRRWKKIDYMNGSTNPAILRSIWVDFNVEMQGMLIPNVTQVDKMDGSGPILYNGTNQTEMIGFYMPNNVANRPAFDNRVYLAPVPEDQITLYRTNGFTLTQTSYGGVSW
jgi:hypothetical protein